MKFGFCVPILSGLILAGCASAPPLVGSSSVRVVDTAALPPPLRSDIAAPTISYVVAPFDRVAIEVYGVEALSRTVQADGNGLISYPLAGDIPAAGLTLAELGDEIEARLAGRYVRNPQVIVTSVESPRQMVTVDGEVKEPGLFPVVGRMTLLQAVARAKGATEMAELRHVVVFRTVNGQRMAALYDVRAIRAGYYEDPPIYAHDVVTVGQSRARQLFRQVVEAATLITAPIIILLQR